MHLLGIKCRNASQKFHPGRSRLRAVSDALLHDRSEGLQQWSVCGVQRLLASAVRDIVGNKTKESNRRTAGIPQARGLRIATPFRLMEYCRQPHLPPNPSLSLFLPQHPERARERIRMLAGSVQVQHAPQHGAGGDTAGHGFFIGQLPADPDREESPQ